MKKFLLIFTLLVLPKVVYGETFYGGFHETDKKCIESDICKIEKLKKYNTFTVDYIDMGYLEDNDDYIKDESDFIEEESSENISIKTNLTKVDNIIISGLFQEFLIYELEIYSKGIKIEYTPRESMYLTSLENLNDGNLDTYYSHKNSQIFLILYLDKEYDINDLKIRIYTKKQNNNFFDCDIAPSRLNFDNSVDRWHNIDFESTNYMEINYEIETKKKYRYYKENKNIENKYVIDGDNLILDDYIIENKYFSRDKLILSDEIKINEFDTNMEDYILYKTGNVEYVCNLNDKNNQYCNFKLNDINIKKSVILENNNDNKLIDNLDNEIDESNIELDDLTNQVNEIYSDDVYEIEDVNIYDNLYTMYNNENDINESEEKVNKDKKVTKLKKEMDVIDSKSLEKKDKKKIVKIVICILFIVIDIFLIIRRKRKRNNVESV